MGRGAFSSPPTQKESNVSSPSWTRNCRPLIPKAPRNRRERRPPSSEPREITVEDTHKVLLPPCDETEHDTPITHRLIGSYHYNTWMHLSPYTPCRRCRGVGRGQPLTDRPQSGYHPEHLFPIPHLGDELSVSLQIHPRDIVFFFCLGYDWTSISQNPYQKRERTTDHSCIDRFGLYRISCIDKSVKPCSWLENRNFENRGQEILCRRLQQCLNTDEFSSSRTKKARVKIRKYHTKTMMRQRSNDSWKTKINTQDVSLRQNTEEKVRRKGLKTVWWDTNWWNEVEVWKTDMEGPG